MAVKLIIFDLDGTLLNTLKDLQYAVNHALSLFHYPLRSSEEIRSFIGNGIPMLIKRAAPEAISERRQMRLLTCFTEYYSVHHSDFTQPYDGIPELLQTLRKMGYLTAVVSNKQDLFVKELCDRFFPKLFDCEAGAMENLSPKPSPDLVYHVLTKLNISARQTLYVGDSEVDIQTCENCGVDCIAVDWGFRNASYLRSKGARTVISKPEELLYSLDFR